MSQKDSANVVQLIVLLRVNCLVEMQDNHTLPPPNNILLRLHLPSGNHPLDISSPK